MLLMLSPIHSKKYLSIYIALVLLACYTRGTAEISDCEGTNGAPKLLAKPKCAIGHSGELVVLAAATPTRLAKARPSVDVCSDWCELASS